MEGRYHRQEHRPAELDNSEFKNQIAPARQFNSINEMKIFLLYLLRYGAGHEGIRQSKDGYIHLSDLEDKYPNFKDNIKKVIDSSNPKEISIIQNPKGFKLKAINFDWLGEQNAKIENEFKELKTDSDKPEYGYHITTMSIYQDMVRFQGLVSMSTPFIFFNREFPTDQLLMALKKEIIIEVDANTLRKCGHPFKVDKQNKLVSTGVQGRISPQHFKRVIQVNLCSIPVQLFPVDMFMIPYLLVIDFEANCVQTGSLECQEIIEFPCVLLNTKTLETEVFYHKYIKPTVVPLITKFATKLTGITQDQVDDGITIEDALEEFGKLCHQKGLNTGNCSVVTHGPSDIEVFLQAELNYKMDKMEIQLMCPDLLKSYIDCQTVFWTTQYVKIQSFQRMMKHLNMKIEGKHHSGIDDTKNIARMVKELIKQNGLFSQQQRKVVNSLYIM